MNKRKIIYLAAAAVLCISAASCGDKTSSSGSSPAVTAVTTSVTTAAVTETTAAASTTTTAAATEVTTAEEVSDEHLADAVRLFEAISTADMMQAGTGVEIDEEVVNQVNIKINGSDFPSDYFLVTDSRFKSLEQVKQFVADHFCGELLEKYKGLYEGDNASFKEVSGSLYLISSGRNGGFEYTGQPEMTESAEDHFTAKVPVNNMGIVESMVVKSVSEDGKWKASTFTIGKHKANER